MTEPVAPQGIPLQFAAEVFRAPNGHSMVRLRFAQGQVGLVVDLEAGDAEQIGDGIKQTARQSKLGIIIPNGHNV